MKAAYVYPISARDRGSDSRNPYIDDFVASVGENIRILNRDQPSEIGIFGVIGFLRRTDYIFLNWVENVPELRGGLAQALFVRVLLRLKTIMGIKIVWTMHNKISHSGKHLWAKKALFRDLLTYADHILVHAEEGIAFAESIAPGVSKKMLHIAHPVKDRRLSTPHEKTYDVLIWGTISPYKGVDAFLQYLISNSFSDRFRLHVAGEISSESYAREIRQYCQGTITLDERALGAAELSKLVQKSSVVLFTYTNASVLSSGALMDSIGYGARVIGPSIGAFRDLGSLGIISTYETFDDLMDKLEFYCGSQKSQLSNSNLDKFLVENSWEAFAETLLNALGNPTLP